MLADEIDDRPAALALRDVGELQPGELPSPQPAPHQQPQQHPISQPFCRFRIRLGQQPRAKNERLETGPTKRDRLHSLPPMPLPQNPGCSPLAMISK